MKSSTKVSGIAAAVASLVATGAASVGGHAVDGSATIALSDKTCNDHKKGCPTEKRENKKPEHEKESEHRE